MRWKIPGNAAHPLDFFPGVLHPQHPGSQGPELAATILSSIINGELL